MYISVQLSPTALTRKVSSSALHTFPTPFQLSLLPPAGLHRHITTTDLFTCICVFVFQLANSAYNFSAKCFLLLLQCACVRCVALHNFIAYKLSCLLTTM